MTLPNANFWIRADVTLFSLAVSESPFTRTLSFTNKPVISTSTSTVYYPLITNLSDFGARMGTFLPLDSSASLTLNNSWGSFGYNRCITDLLQRFTMINQEVKIYFALDTPEDLEPETWTQIFQGKIRAVDYNAADASQSLIVAISADIIPNRQIAAEIPELAASLSTPVDGHTVVNDSAGVNKIAPLIFGFSQIKPIRQDLAFGKRYVYGGIFSDQFVNDGIQKYYAKNHKGAYVYIQGRSSPTTVQFEDNGTVNAGLFFTWAGQQELIFRFNQTSGSTGLNYNVGGSGNNWLITTMKIQMTSQVGAFFPAAGDRYILKLYEIDAQGLPTIELARSEQPIALYVPWALTPAADYTVSFDFNKPVVLEEASNYAWSISMTKEAASPWSLNMKRYGKASNSKPWVIDQTDASNNKHPYQTNAYANGGTHDYPYFWAYGVSLVDTPGSSSTVQSNGFGYSYFVAERPYSLLGASTPSAIADLGFDWDFLIYAGGITDDVAGTITGEAGKDILIPTHMLKLFLFRWDGSDWVDDSKFEETAYDYSHPNAFDQTTNPLARVLQGRISNRTTLASLLERIAQNAGARLAIRANGKMGVWGWGSTATESATIDQNDLRIIDISYKGVESLINQATVFYEPFIYTAFLSRLVDLQSTRDFAFGAEWNHSTPAKASEYTRLRPSTFSANNFTTPSTNQDTVEAFGVSSLRLNEFDLLGDSSSVEGILSFYFAFYGLPSVFVSVEVPLERYYTLELLDVIEIQHPMLPSFYGSSSYNQNSYNDAGDPIDWKNGIYNPRAETYRAIIESRTFSLGRGQAPKLKLNLRLLLNSPKDPT